MVELRLVIRTMPDANGVTHTFDPLDAAKAAVDGLAIMDPKKEGALLYGRLLPFCEQFRADVLHCLLLPDGGRRAIPDPGTDRRREERNQKNDVLTKEQTHEQWSKHP